MSRVQDPQLVSVPIPHCLQVGPSDRQGISANHAPGASEYPSCLFLFPRRVLCTPHFRAALTTPFRHRVIRMRSPTLSLEEEANAFDELENEERCAVSTKL